MNQVPDIVAKQVSQVPAILPSFVVEDHPKFVEFLKAYYRWNASQGPAAALNYMKLNNDVDFVLDSMLDGFANLFAYNIPKEMKTDYRFFIKFLREFYDMKGSEESYRILYRALFNEDVLVYFPKRNLLIPSDAVWATEKTFRVRYTGDGYALRGKTLKGGISGFRCMVSDVVKVRGHWMVYFQNASGEFKPDELLEVVGTDERMTVVPMYSIVNIVSKPQWHDNDVIKVDDDLIINVDKINYGYITAITIVDGGEGFKLGDKLTTESDYSGTGFLAEVTSVDADGAVLTVSIQRSGFGYVNENVRFVPFKGGNGKGFQANPTWNPEFRTIHSASIILNKEKKDSGEVTHTFGDGDTITFTDGVYTIPKYWKLIKGAPSTETARIHDSYYYQEFSYVLSSIANTNGSEAALKQILQIAGLKMFIEQSVSKTVNLHPNSELHFG